MARFVAVPPTFEARPFTGEEGSVLDIQGWLSANGVESKVVAGKTLAETEIRFGSGNAVRVGEWLIQMGNEFHPITADQLFTNYSMTA